MKSLYQPRAYWPQLSCWVVLVGLCATASGQDQDALKLVARDPAGHGTRLPLQRRRRS